MIGAPRFAGEGFSPGGLLAPVSSARTYTRPWWRSVLRRPSVRAAPFFGIGVITILVRGGGCPGMGVGESAGTKGSTKSPACVA
jgi:hypothetical protein